MAKHERQQAVNKTLFHCLKRTFRRNNDMWPLRSVCINEQEHSLVHFTEHGQDRTLL